VIALHGKGSDAATVMAGGVEQGLAEAVQAGLPPFAVVAVDGGGSYFHRRASGEDSGAMVLDELIRCSAARAWTPRGWVSWAGRWAATSAAARRATRPSPHRGDLRGQPGAVVVLGGDAPGAFDGADDFAANSVRAAALASIPIRIDCGGSDPFYAATKQFIAQLPKPPAGGFSPAGTTPPSGVRNCPRGLTWMAPLLTA
jgi:hypothetical protein